MKKKQYVSGAYIYPFARFLARLWSVVMMVKESRRATGYGYLEIARTNRWFATSRYNQSDIT